MIFDSPKYLWLLLIIIPLVWWYIWRGRKGMTTVKISSLRGFGKIGNSWKRYLVHLRFLIKLLVLALLICIIARPQTTSLWSERKGYGIDIMIALDISTSMLAKDFTPDRFTAAKQVATDFVANRQSDNIGMVVFAAEPFTQVPITADTSAVIQAIKNIRIGVLDDGTAIGDGLATSINRLKDRKTKSKTIILLTDGSNNTGVVDPVTAAQIAKKFGIRVYTIGVGSNTTADYPVAIDYNGNIKYEKRKVIIDDNALRNIAFISGGRYFRATDKSKLTKIFSEIDQMEKSKTETKSHHDSQDDPVPWAIAVLVLLILDALLLFSIKRI